MIDYEKTLKSFFAEIIKYLDGLAKRAPDGITYSRIDAARDIVAKIKDEPFKYSDYNVRVRESMEALPSAFMPNDHDNSIFLLYNRVLNSMGNLKSPHDYWREEAQQKLLNSLKTIKYKNSKNVLKDLYFPFISAKKYAVKTNIETTR